MINLIRILLHTIRCVSSDLRNPRNSSQMRSVMLFRFTTNRLVFQARFFRNIIFRNKLKPALILPRILMFSSNRRPWLRWATVDGSGDFKVKMDDLRGNFCVHVCVPIIPSFAKCLPASEWVDKIHVQIHEKQDFRDTCGAFDSYPGLNYKTTCCLDDCFQWILKIGK